MQRDWDEYNTVLTGRSYEYQYYKENVLDYKRAFVTYLQVARENCFCPWCGNVIQSRWRAVQNKAITLILKIKAI